MPILRKQIISYKGSYEVMQRSISCSIELSLVGGSVSNAKRKVYTMPRLRQQNKGTDTGRYRAEEFSSVLSQVP